MDESVSTLQPLFSNAARHFGLQVEHAYRGCVTESSKVPTSCHEMAPCEAEATITITFDYSTGIIEKAMSLNVAEISKLELKNASQEGNPILYMTK